MDTFAFVHDTAAQVHVTLCSSTSDEETFCESSNAGVASTFLEIGGNADATTQTANVDATADAEGVSNEISAQLQVGTEADSIASAFPLAPSSAPFAAASVLSFVPANGLIAEHTYADTAGDAAAAAVAVASAVANAVAYEVGNEFEEFRHTRDGLCPRCPSMSCPCDALDIDTTQTPIAPFLTPEESSVFASASASAATSASTNALQLAMSLSSSPSATPTPSTTPTQTPMSATSATALVPVALDAASGVGGIFSSPASIFGDPTASARAWESHTAKALVWMRENSGPTQMWRKFGDPSAVGVAVLIETRKDPRLEAVLRNAAQFLAPHGWALRLFAGKQNAEFMRGIVRGWPNVEVQVLNVDGMQPKDYSVLLTTREFLHLLLPHEHHFVFQTDGWFMAPLLPSSDFFKWAFVGSPFNNICFVCKHPILEGSKCCGRKFDDALVHSLAPELVGNGGMSLRRTHAMLKVLDFYHLPANPPNPRPQFVGPDGALVTPPMSLPLVGATSEDVFYVAALKMLAAKNLARKPGSLPIRIPNSKGSRQSKSNYKSKAVAIAGSETGAERESANASASASASGETVEVGGLFEDMTVCPRASALYFGIEQTLPPVISSQSAWALCSHKAYGYMNAAVVQRMLQSYEMVSTNGTSTFRDSSV